MPYNHRSSLALPSLVDEATGDTVPPWSTAGPTTAHPLHSMMSRVGSFPPSLARYLIVRYSRAGDTVFDPFCGKGTTVLQTVLEGRHAVGCDVAPEAVAVTRAKVTPIGLREVEEYIAQIRLRRYGLAGVPDDVKVFFHDITLSRVLCVRDALLRDIEGGTSSRRRAATFLLGCLLGILHGHASYSLSLPSSHAYAMAPNYVRRYAGEHGLEKPIRDVRGCLLKKARILLLNGSVTGHRARVYESTAANYTFNRSNWLAGRVSLVVTSPPYLNAQTYAKDAWLRLWLLGHDYRDLRSRYIQTGSVETYKEEMLPCLRQMLEVMKPGAPAFLVAGDVLVTRQRGKKKSKAVVKTVELLADVAEHVTDGDAFAFRIEEIIDDTIPGNSRYLAAVHKDGNAEWRSNGSGTGVRIERILHLKKVRIAGRKSVHRV